MQSLIMKLPSFYGRSKTTDAVIQLISLITQYKENATCHNLEEVVGGCRKELA
jgi:hypothetical protein